MQKCTLFPPPQQSSSLFLSLVCLNPLFSFKKLLIPCSPAFLSFPSDIDLCHRIALFFFGTIHHSFFCHFGLALLQTLNIASLSFFPPRLTDLDPPFGDFENIHLVLEPSTFERAPFSQLLQLDPGLGPGPGPSDFYHLSSE
ncbi:hypothetical protein H0G86_013159 [Trichoderma simmonsii]|uniref:Uncharacterized protein n=1 Tax=Trichoderma simmonsii TaxID=1491479 RepID=A0A8G0LV50_9HYPO|nr:hypothetical protein H0G86_013159 [Trichoderma simmonsii]